MIGDESIVGDAVPNQGKEGGSIPTSSLHFQLGCLNDATELVKRFHYSRRMPSNIQLVGTLHRDGGLFGDFGPALAACVFTIPPTRWSEDVLELARLVRVEGEPGLPLSRLIKLACVYLKRNGADLLVSFADWTQKHHGGIYQAASWEYGGLRDRQMDGLIVEGRFIPGRSCNSRWGTRSPEKVAKFLGPSCTVAPHFDEGKHLYWKAISKAGREKAKRLSLLSMPYPKPAKANSQEVPL